MNGASYAARVTTLTRPLRSAIHLRPSSNDHDVKDLEDEDSDFSLSPSLIDKKVRDREESKDEERSDLVHQGLLERAVRALFGPEESINVLFSSLVMLTSS